MNQLLPTVSVIIPVYNASLTIKQAIQSAIDQVDIVVEVIIVDDGSTDETVYQVQLMDDPHVKMIQLEKNAGPSAARNRGLEEATKEWIAVLDADDWFDKNRLSTLVSMAVQYQLDVIADNQRLIYDLRNGPTKLRSESLKVLADSIEPRMIDMNVLLNHIGLGIVQPVMRRDFLVQQVLKYQDRHWYGEDFRFLYDLLRHGARMAVTSKPLYNVRIHSASLTADRVKMFSGMKQVLEEIEEGILILGRDDWLLSVRKAIAQTEETIAYGSVMDPLKKRQILKAMRALLSNPRFPRQFANRMFHKIKNLF